MLTIPSQLRTRKISSFIEQIVSTQYVDNFYSLDESDQDTFVALCISALDCDIDVVLNHKGNSLLAKYLMTYERDKAQDVLDALADSAKEQFSVYFNQLLSEVSQ